MGLASVRHGLDDGKQGRFWFRTLVEKWLSFGPGWPFTSPARACQELATIPANGWQVPWSLACRRFGQEATNKRADKHKRSIRMTGVETGH
jgi:hypothetical protein